MQRNNFGKLIISKYNDFYETFHDLQLILVKGNRNEIEIDHKIRKLVINGNNNKIKISSSGKVGQIKLRGNNNIIRCNFFNSYNNAVDYGYGNKVYIRGRRIREQTESSDDEDENANTDNDEEDQDNDEDTLNLYGIRRDIYQMLAQLRRMIVGNSSNHIDADSDEENSEEENLYDLIDISFKKAPIGIKDETEKCVICFENFIHNESIKMTNCFHIFHHNCIKKWIKSKEELDETPDCPICRREL